MIRQNTINTFTGGLVSDLEPLSTPNNVLTDCLNGTISTFNGNADTLQTDMGNAKIGAYLPEGYIPLGSASLDGIIYIVSYNPLTKECQIGSYPSPQRDFTPTDSDPSLKPVKLNTELFGNEKITTYIATLDWGLELNPGDMYYVYMKNDNSYYKDVNNFYDKNKGYIKISLGYVDSNNQIHKLETSPLYNYKYPEIESNSTKIEVSKDLCVDQKDNSQDGKNINVYRVYDTKTSGNLILIAELIKPDASDITIKHTINEENNVAYYKPTFGGRIYNIESKDYFKITKIHYNYSYKGTIIKDGKEYTLDCNWSDVQLIDNPEYQTEYTINHVFNFDNLKDIKFNATDANGKIQTEVISVGDILTIGRNQDKLIYIEVIPELEYGLIDILKQKFIVNLKDVNTGLIELVKYQYLNEYAIKDDGTKEKTYQFYLQLNSYPKVDQSVKNLRINIYNHNSDASNFKIDSEPIKTITFESNNNFHGTFTSLSYEYDEKIYPNNSYVAEIQVDVVDNVKGEKTPYLVGKRFFFTDDVWNEQYKNEDVSDFKDLKYDKDPIINFNSTEFLNNDTVNSNTDTKIFGTLQSDKPKSGEQPNLVAKSYYCHKTDKTIQITPSIIIPQNRAWLYNISIEEISTDNIGYSYKSEQLYDGQSEITDEQKAFFTQDIISNKAISDLIKDGKELNDVNKLCDGIVHYKEDLDIKHPYYVEVTPIKNDEQTNNKQINIVYKDFRFERIFTKKELKQCSYSGSVKPLAYDDTTFGKYNLHMNSINTFVNVKVKTYNDTEVDKYISHTNFKVLYDGEKYYIDTYSNGSIINTVSYLDGNFRLQASGLKEYQTIPTDPQIYTYITITDQTLGLCQIPLYITPKDSDSQKTLYTFVGQLVKAQKEGDSQEQLYINIFDVNTPTVTDKSIDIKVIKNNAVVEANKAIEQKIDKTVYYFSPDFLGQFVVGNNDGISIGTITTDIYTKDQTGNKNTEMNRSNFFFANESAMSDNLYVAGWDNNLVFAFYDRDKGGSLMSDKDNERVSDTIYWRDPSSQAESVAVIIFIKCGNTFIPIKTVTHVEKIGTQEKWTWKGVYDAICKQILQDNNGNYKDSNLFQTIGSMLNNMYRFDNQTIFVDKYIPKENVYENKAVYNVSVPINLKYNIQTKNIENDIAYNKNDNTEASISDTYNITYNQDNIIMNNMIDYIVLQSDTNLRIAIYDRDGSTVLERVADSALQADKIYFVKDGKIVRIPPVLKECFFELDDNAKLKITESTKNLATIDMDINSNFEIVNGLLSLRSPSYQGRKFKAGKKIGSFQDFGLFSDNFNKYEIN